MKWLATLLIVLSFAQAQTAFAAKESKSICKELDETIDGSIKNIALTLAQGEVIDKGVSQQTARLLSANNYLQRLRGRS